MILHKPTVKDMNSLNDAEDPTKPFGMSVISKSQEVKEDVKTITDCKSYKYSCHILFQVQPTRCNVIQHTLLQSVLYMFRVVSPPIIRSTRTLHTASGMCQACLLQPLAW